MMGLSEVPSDSPRFLGMQGMHGRYASSVALAKADLIIALGVRFSDRATGKTEKFSLSATKIHVDCDRAEIGKNVPVDLGIYGTSHKGCSAAQEYGMDKEGRAA